MFTKLLKKIAWGIATLVGVSIIVFILLHMLHADLASTVVGERADPATIAAIRHKLGLDKSLPVQYVDFVRDVLTNNLRSYRNNDRVMSAIMRRFPATLTLAAAGLAIWMIVAIPLGLATAKFRGTIFDRASLFLGLIAISIPTFWLGRILQHYLGYEWGLFSVGGNDGWWNLPLPALTLGLGGAAYYARLFHSNLGSVMNQDYIRSARARGLSEAKVLSKHALRNAIIPVIAVLGLDVASLLSGLIFTEKIFAWPGIGSLAIDSILNLDVPMIMGTVLFSALMVVTANILVDVAYIFIDPRLRM